MQVLDRSLAQSLAAPRSLPPRVRPEMLRRLATGATLLGGPHEPMPVIAPFTGEVIGEVLAARAEDVRHAVARARQAQPAWAAKPVSERAAVLLRYFDLLYERMQEGLDLIQLEAGKARLDAFMEYVDVTMVARYYAFHGRKHLEPQTRPGFIPLLTQTRVHHHPRGVVGIIGPWNYPFTMAVSDALPALLAGNAVVLKPAEQTPFSALWAVRLLYEAGLPPEAFHVVPGHGEEAGDALVGEVDFLHFTGSTAVGRTVARQAGARLTPASLELGGKNPAIVRHDADLRRALPGILQGCFSSTGQLCISTERLYVHEDLFEDFLAHFAAEAEALEMNARYDFSARMGSLVSEDQLEKVTEHVEDALAQGATAVTGAQARPEIGPLFYAPTVLTGVREGMKAFREETFGPVVSVYPFRTDEEALAMANDSAYGLNASVWTRDARAGRRLAERIACGTVSVNDAYVAGWASTAAPMGGFKQSGLGRRHGPEGLLKYTDAQTVAHQVLGPLAPEALGLGAERFAGLTAKALRLLRYLPGLR